jgi:hypothetical protein
MNYKKIYNKIIENRKKNGVEGYSEKHHIIPRCLGGNDNEENLVNLTAREHFLCHILLVKMYKNESFEWYKMNNALIIMKCKSLGQQRYFSSRLYEKLKRNFSSVMRLNQFGKNNSQYNTMWIYNTETKKNKKIKKDEQIPIGWVRGRINVHSDEEKMKSRERLLGTKRPCSEQAKIKLSRAMKKRDEK